MSDKTSNENDAGSGMVVFQPITHPVLRSVNPIKVAEFLRERERYELEVTEKKKEVSTLTKAGYRISIDQGLLKRMHFLGRLDHIAPGKGFPSLTNKHVEIFIKGLIDKEDVPFDHNIIEKALKGLRMPMDIADPEARVLEYVSDFFQRLESVGYESFKDKNPKKTVKLLQAGLYPKKLHDVMKKALEYREDLEKDIKGYVELLCEEAAAHDKYNQPERSGMGNDDKSKVPSDNKSGKGSRSKKERKPNGDESKKGIKTDEQKRQVPLCLNPKHSKEGKRCYMDKCDITSADEAKEMLKKWREQKQRHGAKRLGDVDGQHNKVSDNSTLINAMFAKSVTRVLCADGGSDINLLPPDLCEELERKGAVIKVTQFSHPRRFSMAATKDKEGEEIFVECDKEVKMNVELFIRHGHFLELRNMLWYVSMNETPEPLLGRPTLEALGINTKEMLVAATGKLGNSVDLGALLPYQDYPNGSVARLMQDGIYHSDGGVSIDEEDSEEDSWLDLGDDNKEEIDQAFDDLVQEAGENGISDKGKTRLRNILEEHHDVFRLRLGNDPPADVEPMKIDIKDGARAFRAKSRRYPPSGRHFMERYVKRVLEYGFGKVNTNAKWAAAPVLVAKNGPAKFRLTFDYRPINAVTVSVTWPMPHIDSELADLAGSKYFASIDFVSGYWQLPLETGSQELLSFMTPTTVIQPTRTTQGAKNAGANFQSKVEPLFTEIRDSLKAWMDDFLVHARKEEELLDVLEMFFKICSLRRLKVSAIKSHLFQRSVNWCGRIVDEDGVRFDPRNLSGLQEIHLPVSASELCEYVHCLQWMSQGIPDFANRIAPFKQILEEAYKISGSRTKKSIKRIAISSLSWNKNHETLFHEFQEQLRQMVKLSHRDSKKALCIYTDASDAYWAGVVTQCEFSDLDKDISEQRHQPLGFLGAAFKGSEEWWTTFEKEAFAIVEVFKKMDYLFMTEDETHVHTDHRNLLFVYNPLALDATLGRHIVNKVQRWGLYLSRYSYVIEHVDGDKNIMADIMTRWFRGYRGKRMSAKRITHALLQRDIVESPFDESFEWPSSEKVRQSQEKHRGDADKSVTKTKNGLWTKKGKDWIPQKDADLQLKLLVVAHCGSSGHRDQEATCSILKENYCWDTMNQDCGEFVKDCLHCLTGKTGQKIPRPLSLTVHGSKPNEVIHFDFLYMGPGIDEHKYVLVVKDDLSGYVWLCPAKSADAETAAGELARWIRVFTIMSVWVSDQGSHFKNAVMTELADEHRIKHRFTVAYSPWVNGTVENCMRHVQAAYRCLQSEMKLGPQDWPTVIGMIMTVLNEAPLKRLGTREDGTYRAPLEVMTGIKPARSMLNTTTFGDTNFEAKSLEKAKAMQILEINTLQEAFNMMHKDVSKRVSHNRAKHIKQHNKKTNLVTPNFSVGDFVVVRKAQDKGHKQSFRWIGPRRIIKIVSELVYEVESLISRKVEQVHAARLKLYRAHVDGAELSEKLMEHAENSEAKYELIDKMLDISEVEQEGMFVQVQWLGLPDKRDWTWQPLKEMHEDVPERLEEFLRTSKKKRLSKKALSTLGVEH